LLLLGTGDCRFRSPKNPQSGIGQRIEARDVDDDGSLDISAPIGILGGLFLGLGQLPLPGPAACGPDPTPDDLGCRKSCP